jgi:ribose transport system permease protein
MRDIGAILRRWPFAFAAALAVALLVANEVAQPSFGAPSNWPELLTTLAPFAVLGMASTPAILSGGGGLDISVGPLAVVVNVMIVAWLLPHSGLDNPVVAIAIVLAFGALVGAINGFLVAVLRYQPVIATLCTFFVLSGLVLKIAPEARQAPQGAWTADLADKIGPIPGGLLLVLAPLAIWLLLRFTAFHRNLYAVGGNDATAFSAGIDVARTRILAYAVGGLFAAIGGIALTALVQSTLTSGVTQYTLVALAAVALGGTSFGGGRGGIAASLLGAICIYLMQTLLGSLHVSTTWLQVVYGGMLVTGVIIGGLLALTRPRVVGL